MAEEKGLDAIVKLVQNLGLNEELWRGYLGDQLSKKIKDADVKDAAIRVRELAGLSADKIKSASTKNPTMFYSGLAALVLGAGLMAKATRDNAEELDQDAGFTTGTHKSGELHGDAIGDEVQPRAATSDFDDDDLAH